MIPSLPFRLSQVLSSTSVIIFSPKKTSSPSVAFLPSFIFKAPPQDLFQILSFPFPQLPSRNPNRTSYSHKPLLSINSMGFPVSYTDLLLPKLLIHALSLLYFLRKLTRSIFNNLGLPNFFEPSIPAVSPLAAMAPDFSDKCQSISAVLLRAVLPVVKFSDLDAAGEDPCAVCLTEFAANDEVRQLANCRHMFHRGCVDGWLGYDRRSCPLCRMPVVPDDVHEAFNERLWAAFGISDDLYAAAVASH